MPCGLWLLLISSVSAQQPLQLGLRKQQEITLPGEGNVNQPKVLERYSKGDASLQLPSLLPSHFISCLSILSLAPSFL